MVSLPCRWPWRSAQRHRKVSCWYPPKQSGNVRRKPEKYTSIHLNSKKICSLLVFRRAEMASWYWYLRIYQRFLWVSTWVLGFWWTKREDRNHVFLSDFGLLWTILDFLVGAKGRLNHKIQSTEIKDKAYWPLCKYRSKYRRQAAVDNTLNSLRKIFDFAPPHINLGITNSMGCRNI